MRILPATAAHRDAVVALWEACGLTRPWNDPYADLDRALDGPSSTVVIALDGSVVGTVMVGHDGHRGWVYYLAVDPGRRDEGLGRRLMEAAESRLQEWGLPKVQLMVRADNDEVVSFYRRLGYADQGVVVLGRFFDPELQRSRADQTQGVSRSGH